MSAHSSMDSDGGSSLSQQRDQELIKHLGRHVVAIAGNYQWVTEDTTPKAELRFFAIAACVLAVGDRWFLLTAGHCIQKYLELANSKKAEFVGRALCDAFGTDAIHSFPIPFDLESEEFNYVYDDELGLDFGIITIGQNLRDLLSVNGVRPLTPHNWGGFRASDNYEYHYVLGFPDEDASPIETGNGVGGIFRPALMPIEKLESDLSKEYPRFSGRVKDMGDHKSITGFSGGPIWGANYSTTSKMLHFYLVAIQSGWDKKDTVFGCPLTEIAKLVFNRFLARREETPTGESDSYGEAKDHP